MTGLATNFEILRLVIADLQNKGDPNNIAADMTAHSEYAHFGAIGAAVGDFLTPPFPEDPPFPTDYKTLWRRIFHVLGRRDVPGLYYVLQELNDVLDQVGAVVDAEDCDALVDLRDNGIEDRISTVTTQFATAVANVQAEAFEIADLIGTGLKPNVLTPDLLTPVPAAETWPPRDFLHWTRTGDFVNALLETADERGDARLRAYALGYLVSYAANVCGAGHGNSITGGPARTQWWRQRFVANYVDAWVFGYYGQAPRPTFSGDTPSPGYDSGQWPDLCASALYLRLSIGAPDPEELMDLAARGREFPTMVPADFAENWFAAADKAFDAMPDGLTAEGLNSAYVFHWLVLWFRTSGEVLPCNPAGPAAPPEGCGESESELDPFVNGVPLDGVVPQPPDPNIDADVDTAAVICGIILAILGGILVLGGNVVLGGAAIAAGVAMLDCDNVTDIDWKELRCLIFHERMYLHNALIGIHRLLAVAGLDYPYAKELANDEDFQDLFPFLDPWETGKNMTKSKVKEAYPGQAWDGQLISFNRPPTSFESPHTVATRDIGYPNVFVDDPAHPVANGGVKTAVPTETWADGGPYKSMAPASTAGGRGPASFGNAVENAVDLFSVLGEAKPDWNLDADRGLASLNWRFILNYNPDDVKIKPAD